MSLLLREQSFVEGVRTLVTIFDGTARSLLLREQPFVEGSARSGHERTVPSLLLREQPFVEVKAGAPEVVPTATVAAPTGAALR